MTLATSPINFAGHDDAPIRALPRELDLVPIARHPTRLSDATLSIAESLAIPRANSSSTIHPKTSIIVVSYGGVSFTKLCLTALLTNTRPDFELIIVDNASSDGTVHYLQDVADEWPNVRLISNRDNLGFGRACNQGLEIARGDTLVLLNNDTIVPRKWLSRLTAHLSDPSVGAVGPTTNRIGNEAEIDVRYRTYGQLEHFAKKRAREHGGEIFDIPMLTMFCFAMRRATYERIGPLDTQFEIGLFEDDDYAMRLRAAGLRLACARDAFVHHFHQASFGQLVPDGRYKKLFEENRLRFERKWNRTWAPHRRPPSDEYTAQISRIRKVVARTLSSNELVAVINKSDEQLLHLPPNRCRAFPCVSAYPADDAAAIAHLAAAREAGAGYLLIPSHACWWLERYPQFARRLQGSDSSNVVHRDDDCVIFDIRQASTAAERAS